MHQVPQLSPIHCTYTKPHRLSPTPRSFQFQGHNGCTHVWILSMSKSTGSTTQGLPDTCPAAHVSWGHVSGRPCVVEPVLSLSHTWQYRESSFPKEGRTNWGIVIWVPVGHPVGQNQTVCQEWGWSMNRKLVSITMTDTSAPVVV
jgi:hypothetical protein